MPGFQDRTGCPNEITKVTRHVFNDAFIELGGVSRLMRWAQGYETTCTTEAKPDKTNLKHFYTLFAKVLPKEIKTEDMNRTHEQFIELIQMENQHMLDTKGKPLELVESVPEKQENSTKVT
ncbi:MAG: hypothetical protein ACUZ8I_14310 [Candidatus Scalindua sp.]